MKLRQQFAKAIRSKVGSAILMAAIGAPSVGGGYVAYDHFSDDMEHGTSPVSQAFRNEVLMQTDKILQKRQRLYMMREGAEDALNVETQKGFMDQHDALQDALLAQAKELAVNTLTNTQLTEEDFEVIEDRFDNVERAFSYTGNPLRLNMPGNPDGLKECQLETKGYQNKSDQAYAMRDCMMDRQEGRLYRIGTSILAGVSLLASFGAAGGSQAPQRLANYIEKPSRRRRRFGPPAN